MDQAKAIFEKPTIIIAHTIPGKGVDFMKKNHARHYDQLMKYPDFMIWVLRK